MRGGSAPWVTATEGKYSTNEKIEQSKRRECAGKNLARPPTCEPRPNARISLYRSLSNIMKWTRDPVHAWGRVGFPTHRLKDAVEQPLRQIVKEQGHAGSYVLDERPRLLRQPEEAVLHVLVEGVSTARWAERKREKRAGGQI